MLVTERKNNGPSFLQIQTTTRRRGAGIILAILGVLFLLGTGAAQRAQAQTTTLTFDEFAEYTQLTTQYQSLGVTADGATILQTCGTCTYPAVSGSNEAYSLSGTMTFSFDSTVIGGNVQTVSAYATDYNGLVGIYAYDSSGNLLGQSLMPAAGVNVFLSVTSTGNPIAYVTIHDSGSQFDIDNLSFTWGPSTFSLLHSFDGTNGASPWGGVIMDASGNLYGTTALGGTVDTNCPQGCGTAYKLSPSGGLTVLHKFSDTNGDAVTPEAGLIMDSSGNLYGTSFHGGTFSSSGAVFKLDSSGTLTVLHSFNLLNTNDASYPWADLVLGPSGNLYGTTFGGGFGDPRGSVFKLDTSGNNFSVLHAFNGSDGASPYAGLIMDSSGNLEGTTGYGGSGCTTQGCGTVFKLDTSGNNFSVPHSFSDANDQGVHPFGNLVEDSSGNLYGTTNQGGNLSDCSGYGCGTVFKLDPNGQLTVLHRFSGSDGAGPWAGLVLDSSGTLYGTTTQGGTSTACSGGCGTIFRVDTSGSNFSVLYSFNESDGEVPIGGRLFIDAAGTLYGTTDEGGDSGDGTIFKFATASSSQQALSNMVNYANALYQQGVLTSGQDNSLVKEIQKAIDMMNKGKIAGAISNLEDFITEVNDLSSSGVLSPAQAGALISAANSVITQLQAM